MPRPPPCSISHNIVSFFFFSSRSISFRISNSTTVSPDIPHQVRLPGPPRRSSGLPLGLDESWDHPRGSRRRHAGLPEGGHNPGKASQSGDDRVFFLHQVPYRFVAVKAERCVYAKISRRDLPPEPPCSVVWCGPGFEEHQLSRNLLPAGCVLSYHRGVLSHHPCAILSPRCVILSSMCYFIPRVCYLITHVLSYHRGVLYYHPCVILSPVCYLITRVLSITGVCNIITRVLSITGVCCLITRVCYFITRVLSYHPCDTVIQQ